MSTKFKRILLTFLVFFPLVITLLSTFRNGNIQSYESVTQNSFIYQMTNQVAVSLGIQMNPTLNLAVDIFTNMLIVQILDILFSLITLIPETVRRFLHEDG